MVNIKQALLAGAASVALFCGVSPPASSADILWGQSKRGQWAVSYDDISRGCYA